MPRSPSPPPGENQPDAARGAAGSPTAADLRAANPFRSLAELESALKRTDHELTVARDELRCLSSAVAHDLRGPIRLVIGFAELLGEEWETLPAEEARSHLARIVNAAHRLDTLVMDLLAYCRIGTAEFEFEEVDLDEIAAAVLQGSEALQPHAAAFDVRPPLGRITACRWIVRQVLLELFDNAIKFRRENVPLRVTVRTERRGAVLRLWIEDNGIGVPQEHREKIWQMFERLGPHRGGNGAGLALVQCGITRLNGASGVDSDGCGARFWVELDGSA